jgi:hypothetical protein
VLVSELQNAGDGVVGIGRGVEVLNVHVPEQRT